MSKRLLIAPTAFKGSLSAIETAKTIKLALDSLKLDMACELAPIADGGDDTASVINFYFKKSKLIKTEVSDPLMRKIESSWLLLDNETAVIELAKASGITLLKENELNPMWANTFGTGELILSALDKGCTKIIIALGGSATVDAGLGILQALGAKFFDKKKKLVKAGGGFLSSIEEIDLSSLDKRIKKTKFHVLCDVQIPLIGEKGTVQRFSSQKGAKEGEKVVLELGMKHFSELVSKTTSSNHEMEPMVGAAGGVAFSLKAFLGAELFSGFSYLANMISLEEKIKNADVIITGEGKLDSQTPMGKAVYELAKLAGKYKKKVIALCGNYDESINWATYNIDSIVKIQPEQITIDEALINARNLIENSIKSEYKLFINH